MDAATLRGFSSALEAPMLKQALIEQLVRLGATDVLDLPGVRKMTANMPKTQGVLNTRLLMRHRDPVELSNLQHGIAEARHRFTEPVVNAVDRGLARVPGMKSMPRVQKATSEVARLMVENPDFALSKLNPIPGSSFAYLGAKKGVEKALDRFAPVALPVPMPRV